MRRGLIGLVSMLVVMPSISYASALNGSELSAVWAIPFAGILLSLALIPLFFPEFWHRHYGKVALFWACTCIVPLFLVFHKNVATTSIAHAILGDYIPFLLFVGALYTIAGGIHIQSSFAGRPGFNSILLLTGAILANLMGTTGAAMLLIRPLIKANEGRRYVVQTYIFFIFLVANIGGSLTPLGDPPLFLGFLRGVSFFWTMKMLILPWLVTVFSLLIIYFVIDWYFYKKEVQNHTFVAHAGKQVPLKLEGWLNVVLLICVAGVVLGCGSWKSGVSFEVLGVHLSLEGLVRDMLFFILGVTSYLTTSESIHDKNHFGFEPIEEIAKLFFGIFICIVPVIEMLKAGSQGVFAPIVALVTTSSGQLDNHMFFWMTGMLSGFLDNAPTYLAFFNLAGGHADVLMTADAKTLMAISMGAVFMGALSYIGNAPNLMTVSIVKRRGVAMPSFFGYLIWSVSILFPVFYMVSHIFL